MWGEGLGVWVWPPRRRGPPSIFPSLRGAFHAVISITPREPEMPFDLGFWGCDVHHCKLENPYTAAGAMPTGGLWRGGRGVHPQVGCVASGGLLGCCASVSPGDQRSSGNAEKQAWPRRWRENGLRWWGKGTSRHSGRQSRSERLAGKS